MCLVVKSEILKALRFMDFFLHVKTDGMISDLSFFSSSQHNLIKMIDKIFNDKLM